MGPFANCVDDVILLDEIVSGEKHLATPNPKDIRIGLPNENYYEDLDPEVQSVAKHSIKKLKEQGFTLVSGDGIRGVSKYNKTYPIQIMMYELPVLLL